MIKRVENWQYDGKNDRFNVSCMRIGDLAVVAMPGEIFTAWGLEIKRYSPAKHTFVVELASSDGLTGYKPTSDQALRGGLVRASEPVVTTDAAHASTRRVSSSRSACPLRRWTPASSNWSLAASRLRSHTPISCGATGRSTSLTRSTICWRSTPRSSRGLIPADNKALYCQLLAIVLDSLPHIADYTDTLDPE